MNRRQCLVPPCKTCKSMRSWPSGPFRSGGSISAQNVSIWKCIFLFISLLDLYKWKMNHGVALSSGSRCMLSPIDFDPECVIWPWAFVLHFYCEIKRFYREGSGERWRCCCCMSLGFWQWKRLCDAPAEVVGALSVVTSNKMNIGKGFKSKHVMMWIIWWITPPFILLLLPSWTSYG